MKTIILLLTLLGSEPGTIELNHNQANYLLEATPILSTKGDTLGLTIYYETQDYYCPELNALMDLDFFDYSEEDGYYLLYKEISWPLEPDKTYEIHHQALYLN
jgi:hypothetical protein